MSEPIVFKNPDELRIRGGHILVGQNEEDDNWDFNDFVEDYEVVITITKKVKPFEPGYYRPEGAERSNVQWFDGEIFTVPAGYEAVEVTKK